MKVAILGSCVTRDAFNYDSNKDFEITHYFARTSLISQMLGKGNFKKYNFEKISSNFQKNMIQNDIDSTFLDKLDDNFDVLLVDFIDERFNLLVNKEEVLTLSSEFVSSENFYSSEKVLESGSFEWFELWKKAFKDFIDSYRLKFNKRILINKVFWSVNKSNGSKFSDQSVDDENLKLNKIYGYVEEILGCECFITYDESEIIANSDHVWGEAPFHYVDDLYYKTLIRLKKEMAHSYLAWKCDRYSYDNLDDFLASDSLYDGIHSVDMNGAVLDLYLKGMNDLTNIKGSFLVGFSGAIGSRSGKSAPFFSGLGVADDLALPLVSVSDPSLALDSNLSLSWYAGNEANPEISKKISYLLDSLAYKIKLRPLLFGGSAGGFASILISSMMSVDLDVFVWNPQTNITEYLPEFVEDYKRSCFSKSDNSAEEIFKENKIKYDLSKVEFKENVNFYYIQNLNDWHHRKHAMPFLKSIGLDGNASNYNARDMFILADYSGGHAPLNKISITEIVSMIASKKITRSRIFEEICNMEDVREAYNNYLYNVNDEVCEFKKGDEDSLVVFLNGAINRSVKAPPIFQRSSWLPSFQSHCLIIPDKIVEINSSLELSWYLDKRGDFLRNIREYVIQKASELKVKHEKIVFYGSSGGGYAALMLASMVEGSVAIAINPQINLRKYIGRVYQKFLVDTARHDLMIEHDLKDYFEFIGRIPNMIYVQNRGDVEHVNNQYIPFMSWLSNIRNDVDTGIVSVLEINKDNGHSGILNVDESNQVISQALALNYSGQEKNDFSLEKSSGPIFLNSRSCGANIKFKDTGCSERLLISYQSDDPMVLDRKIQGWSESDKWGAWKYIDIEPEGNSINLEFPRYHKAFVLKIIPWDIKKKVEFEINYY